MWMCVSVLTKDSPDQDLQVSFAHNGRGGGVGQGGAVGGGWPASSLSPRFFWGGGRPIVTADDSLGGTRTPGFRPPFVRAPHKNLGLTGVLKLLVFFQQFLKMPIPLFTNNYDKESSFMYEPFCIKYCNEYGCVGSERNSLLFFLVLSNLFFSSRYFGQGGRVNRLWVNFHTEGSRPRTRVIFGACTCCNQRLGAPCKNWREFSKNCNQKKSPSWKGDFGIYQNSRLAPFGATFPRSRALHLCGVCSPWDLMHNLIFPPAIGDLQRFLLLFSCRGEGGHTGRWFSILDGQFSKTGLSTSE